MEVIDTTVLYAIKGNATTLGSCDVIIERKWVLLEPCLPPYREYYEKGFVLCRSKTGESIVNVSISESVIDVMNVGTRMRLYTKNWSTNNG